MVKKKRVSITKSRPPQSAAAPRSAVAGHSSVPAPRVTPGHPSVDSPDLEINGAPTYWANWLLGALLASVLCWAYWPSLAETVNAWNTQADYSHGFIVIPIAATFLWLRRGEFPRGLTPAYGAAALVLLAVGIRVWAASRFIDTVDALTIPIWAAGVVATLGGWRLLAWCWPAIAFLYFMFPLPFSAERALSRPLQSIATNLSSSVLQLVGQPAIAEGNTILIGDHVLEVEQACSGLRIFMGIFALAFACLLLTRRPWWEKGLVLLGAVPIALISNSTRIVVTALLHEYVSGEAARTFTHDISGYAMILFAASLFWAYLTYLTRLIPEYELLEAGHLIVGSAPAPQPQPTT